MTAIQPHQSLIRRSPAGAALRTLVIRWTVCPRAAAAVLSRAGGPEDAAGESPASLEWHIVFFRGGAAARAMLLRADGGSLVVAESTDDRSGVTVERDGGRGLEHIDVPGLLAATIAAPGGADEAQPVVVLYARTTLFASLGIPGGRYEAAGAAVCGFTPAESV